MHSTLRTIFIIALSICCFVFLPRVVEAATVSVVPHQTSPFIDESFLVDVMLDSEQDVINAVDLAITYPTDLLQLVSVQRGGSFLTLWPADPVIDNEQGVVTLTGGIPNGSMVFTGKVATLEFVPLTAGGAEIAVDGSRSRILLNDGLGTAVELHSESSICAIIDRPSITITSPTHPDESTWYAENDIELHWTVDEGASYSYVLKTNPNAVPDDHPEPDPGQASFLGVDDGVYYFILRERVGDNWETVGKRRVMVDTADPLPFSVGVERGTPEFNDEWFLTFVAQDRMSGISHYDVIEGTTVHMGVASPYVLSDQARGQTVIVRAVDFAGNERLVTLGGTESATDDVESSSIPWYWYVIVAGMIILSGVLFRIVRGRLNQP